MVGTWLGEICSCSSLAVLPDSAWVLLNKVYQPFFTSLQKYTRAWIPKVVPRAIFYSSLYNQSWAILQCNPLPCSIKGSLEEWASAAWAPIIFHCPSVPRTLFWCCPRFLKGPLGSQGRVHHSPTTVSGFHHFKFKPLLDDSMILIVLHILSFEFISIKQPKIFTEKYRHVKKF